VKPENCLLADDGRVKITDLGLATKITPTLHGAAGTRGYWAPEMLRRDAKGKRMTYGHTVDWFSFGCCVAEFICGYNPFRSEAALKFGIEHGHKTKVSVCYGKQRSSLSEVLSIPAFLCIGQGH
jgi:beta-adrenergic-receptor kinase